MTLPGLHLKRHLLGFLSNLQGIFGILLQNLETAHMEPLGICGTSWQAVEVTGVSGNLVVFPMIFSIWASWEQLTMEDPFWRVGKTCV